MSLASWCWCWCWALLLLVRPDDGRESRTRGPWLRSEKQQRKSGGMLVARVRGTFPVAAAAAAATTTTTATTTKKGKKSTPPPPPPPTTTPQPQPIAVVAPRENRTSGAGPDEAPVVVAWGEAGDGAGVRVAAMPATRAKGWRAVAVSPSGARVALAPSAVSGEVVVADAKTGAVVASVSRPDAKLVSNVAFWDDDVVIVASGDAPDVVALSLTSKLPVFTLRTPHADGVACVVADPATRLVATAAIDIAVWSVPALSADTADDEDNTPNVPCVARFTGHAARVTSLAFSTTDSSPVLLVSAAQDDLFVNAWPRSAVAQPSKAKAASKTPRAAPLASLSCARGSGAKSASGAPHTVAVTSALMPDDAATVLAATAGGSVLVWRLPATTPPTGSLEPSASVSAPKTLGADFIAASGDIILVRASSAVGHVAFLESYALVADGVWSSRPSRVRSTGPKASKNGAAEEENEDEAVAMNGNGHAALATSSADKTPAASGKAVRIDRTGAVLTSAAAAASTAAVRSRTDSSVSLKDEQDVPLAQRLAEMTRILAAPASASSAADAAATTNPTSSRRGSEPSADSLSATLEQALQTEDKERIEAVLGNTDRRVITATVARLPTAKLPRLLQELATRIDRRPGRAPQLLLWLGVVLETRGAELSADTSADVEAARGALRRIYHLAEARVATFGPLLRLQGRLDLLLSRVGTSGSTDADDEDRTDSAAGRPRKRALLEFDVA